MRWYRLGLVLTILAFVALPLVPVTLALAPRSKASVSDPALVTQHSIQLENLDPETTYHYRVRSCDAARNCASSEDQTFTTLATAPVQAASWVNISPAGVSVDFNNPPNNFGFHDIVADPRNPGTVYVGTNYQGVWKSSSSGSSWSRVDQPWGTSCASLDGRIWALAIDTFNSNLYAANGYGCFQGLFKSTDGGVHWAPMFPANFATGSWDIGDIQTDPTQANHVLASFRSGWHGGANAGVVESLDGGATWILHEPQAGWGTGQMVFPMGNATTWLLGSQGAGMWKTTNSGGSWTKVSNENMIHGGTNLYHASNGAWYTGSLAGVLRSTNNGDSWTLVMPSGNADGIQAIWGDGTNLYTRTANTGSASTGPLPYRTSLETDGLTWTDDGSQTFADGPNGMAYDAVNHLLYSSNWLAGVWRRASNGVVSPPTALPYPTATAQTCYSAIIVGTADPPALIRGAAAACPGAPATLGPTAAPTVGSTLTPTRTPTLVPSPTRTLTPGAPMAALVSNRKDALGQNGGTSGTLNTTGANLLVVVIGSDQGQASPTVTDSKSNTWTVVAGSPTSIATRTTIAYSKNPTVGTGHTFTITGTNIYAGLAVMAFSGADTTSPEDQHAAASSGGGTVTTIQPGSITPTTDNQVVVVGQTNNAGGAISIDSGFTLVDDLAQIGGVNYGTASAYKVQTTAAAVNPTVTNSSSVLTTVEQVSFKAGAAATKAPPPFARQWRRVNRQRSM